MRSPLASFARAVKFAGPGRNLPLTPVPENPTAHHSYVDRSGTVTPSGKVSPWDRFWGQVRGVSGLDEDAEGDAPADRETASFHENGSMSAIATCAATEAEPPW